VVAYIALVAPAEIVLFVERQLSDEGALAVGQSVRLSVRPFVCLSARLSACCQKMEWVSSVLSCR